MSTYQETHHPHTSQFWDCWSLHTTHSQISPDRKYNLAGWSSPDSNASAFPQSPPNPDICRGWSESCSGWMGSMFCLFHTKNIHSFPKCKRNNSSFWKKSPNFVLVGCFTTKTFVPFQNTRETILLSEKISPKFILVGCFTKNIVPFRNTRGTVLSKKRFTVNLFKLI